MPASSPRIEARHLPESGHRTEATRLKKYFGRGDIALARAERFDIELKREKRKIEVSSITVGQLCQIYHHEHVVEESTALNDKYKFRTLLEVIGHIPVEALASKDLNSYVNQHLNLGRKRATLSREIRLLKAEVVGSIPIISTK